MENKNTPIDWEILRKAAVGKADRRERRALRQWLEASADHRAYFQKMQAFYAAEYSQTLRQKQSYQRRLAMSIASVAAVLLACVYFLLPNTMRSGKSDLKPTTLASNKNITLTLPSGEKRSIDPRKDQVVSAENDTLQVHGGEIAYYNEKRNEEENSYHTIEVPSGTSYKVVLSDSSVVHLNAKSKITFPVCFAEDSRSVRLEGEAFFDIRKDGRPFTVEVNEKRIRVLGTTFNVSSQLSGEVEACLVTGSIEMSDEFNRSVVLAPNQKANCTASGIEVSAADLSDILAWHRGLFSFNQESLAHIMSELSDWYDLEVNYADDALRALEFTGMIGRGEPVDKLLRYFEKTRSVAFDIQNNKITVKHMY